MIQPTSAVTYDPREPEAVIMSLDLVAFRPDTPSMADTLAGVGLWHLAHIHEVRTHITLTGHVVSVIVTPMPPGTAPTAARTARFVVPCHTADVVAILDHLFGAK
jgi:hypothetical protein